MASSTSTTPTTNAPNTPYFGESATQYNGSGKQPPVTPQYPPMPTVSSTRPLLDSFGATGTAIFSGIISSEEYNPDWYWREGVKIIEQMVRNDGQINATRTMLELPIRRATWSIVPASDDPRDEEIAAFVQSCLFDDMCYQTASGRLIHQKWDDVLRHILMHLTYGFMTFEINWRVEDGFVKWSHWTPLLPRSLWRWWVGGDNELAGIQQWTFKNYGYVFIDIPADKLLHFARQQEGNNFEGVSVFRSAYKHWWYKQSYEKIDAIGIERNAVVPPVVRLPEGHSAADVAAAQLIGQNMRVNEQMSVTLPFGWDVEYPKNQQRYAANTLTSIEYHDIMIARNVLCQFINLGSTETGAYSLDRSQVNTFLASLQAVCEYVEDVINADAIRRLVDYNYGGVENYPKLRCSKLTAQNTEALAESLAKLVAGPVALLTPDATLEDFLRTSFGVPSAPRNTVETTNPGSPANPERPQNERSGDHSDEESKNVTPRGGSSGSSSKAAAGVASADASDGAAASEASAIRAEARLLRETLDAAFGVDAVERGMVFYNPYPRQSGGRFGFGGPGHGGASGGGAAHHGGGGQPTAEDVSGGAHTGGGSTGSGGGGGGASSGGNGSSGAAAKGGASSKGSRAKTTTKTTTTTSQTPIRELTPGERAARGLKPEVNPKSIMDEHGFVRPDVLATHSAVDTVRLDPFNTHASDIHKMIAIYGEHQLAANLHNYHITTLRGLAKEVGIAPGRTKAEVISRLTAHFTAGRYNGRFGTATSGARSSNSHAARVARLEKQIADHEAKLTALRAKHAELTRQGTAKASELAGLETDIASEVRRLSELLAEQERG